MMSTNNVPNVESLKECGKGTPDRPAIPMSVVALFTLCNTSFRSRAFVNDIV